MDITHDQLRTNLIRFMWGYEAIVITTCIGAGAMLAVGNGGSLIMAVPLLLIAAAELMRIPLSAWSTRLPWYGQILAGFVLLCIAVGSFEGLSLAFEQFVNNRVVEVMRADNNVIDARVAIDTKNKTLQGAKDELTIAQQAVADVNSKITANHHPTRASGSTSKCKNSKGIEYSCAADNTNAKAFAADIDAFNRRAKELDAEAKTSQNRVNDLAAKFATLRKEDITPLMEKLRHAEAEKNISLRLSPMHRLAASVYGVKVTELTEDQFETVKKYAVFGLAGAFSILSMLVSVVAHTKPAGKEEHKLNRAIRAYFARKRKPLKIYEIKEIEVFKDGKEIVEIEKEVEVPGPERVIVKWIAYDLATGRKINPDLTLGEKAHLTSVKGGK